MSAEIVVTTWKVADLRAFHLQDEYFGLRSEEELQELEAAINRSGMDPLDIVVKEEDDSAEGAIGIILAGHQRWHLAKYKCKRYREEVPVRIRYDLMAKGPEAIEQYFLDSNTANRRLS